MKISPFCVLSQGDDSDLSPTTTFRGTTAVAVLESGAYNCSFCGKYRQVLAPICNSKHAEILVG